MRYADRPHGIRVARLEVLEHILERVSSIEDVLRMARNYANAENS